jgi:hypothetical protein
MKKLLLFSIATFTFLSVLLLACQKETPPSPEAVLSAAIEKIQSHPAIQYQYRSHWDNRFNESTFADSAQVIYSKLDSSQHGFGFSANTYNYKSAHLYDGFTYKEIRHPDKLIVGYDKEEVAADSAYFSSRMFFLRTPFELSSDQAFENVWDTIIDHTSLFVYQQVRESPSVVDSTKTVRQEKHYFIDSQDPIVRRVKSFTMTDGDTSQVIEHVFTDVQFDALPYEFSDLEQSAFTTYTEVSDKVLESEQYLDQIAEGDRLTRSNYPNIQGKGVELYGESEQKSLIMFSFIGCGGCEYAMSEMKKKDFKIREGLHFYYSSPLDKSSTLQSYLEKKGFPFSAFSKESNMNEDFSVLAFPTFVLINSEGEVSQVVSGYTAEVREMLFGEGG